MRDRYNRARRAAQRSGVNSVAAPDDLREARASALRQFLRKQATIRLHRPGARVTYEFIAEIVRHHPDIETEVDQRLDRLSNLNPQVARALTVDRFPEGPIIRVVPDADDGGAS